MTTLLTINLSTRTANNGGAAWTPPTFTYGDTLTFALRFLRNVDGQLIEPTLDVRGLTAAIGAVDGRPLARTWALQVGMGVQTDSNTTTTLQHDVSGLALAAAINGIGSSLGANGAATVVKKDGSFLITFADAIAAVPMIVRNNDLFPVSIGRITASLIDGKWVHELRLVQTPVAFTDASARVLPAAPSISEVRAGGSSGGFSWNEIQALYVPPDFRGTFSLKKGFARTGQLSTSDDATSIQAALEAAIGKNVTVTNPAPFTVFIEFTNELEGEDIALLEVVPLNPPPGDLTFTLPLNKAELIAALRVVPTLTLPLVIKLSTADADDVVTTEEILRQLVTIQRPVIFDELATVPAIDWLRPPSPKDYVPFSETTFVTGHQFYRAVLGDGAATVFVLDHGLATDDYVVFGRENTSGGRQLTQGVDFSVVDTDDNSATVTALDGPPALNIWVFFVISCQTVEAFAAGLTVTIGQVTGLRTELDTIEAAVSALAALAPTTPLGTTTAAGATVTITIPDLEDAFPRHIAGKPLDVPTLRAGFLLPALHVASATSLTSGPLPAFSGHVGEVYQNNTGAAIVLPGGGGTPSGSLEITGFAGSDGRRWYPVTHAGTTKSYFPRDYERQLFMFEASAQMLRASTTLDLNFSLFLELLNASTRMQAIVVVEHGTAPSDTSPATTSPNLQNIVWNATPLLSQRVIVGPVGIPHKFGVQVIRAADGTLTANQVLYGFATAAGSIPASADVAIRARLINWDTENSVTNATGTIHFKLTEASALIG